MPRSPERRTHQIRKEKCEADKGERRVVEFETYPFTVCSITNKSTPRVGVGGADPASHIEVDVFVETLLVDSVEIELLFGAY